LQSRLFNEAVDGYFARHRVKPGITGWAQINGWRGEVDSEEKEARRVRSLLHRTGPFCLTSSFFSRRPWR
jgi:lipopolysaccharide/colanic/teichoic acid biosynthesis glycosyltransferase